MITSHRLVMQVVALAILLLIVMLPRNVLGDGAIGPAALTARHATLAPELSSNAFGRRISLSSREGNGRVQGDVYAVLDHPFATVHDVLAERAKWCDLLILHLNTKHCRQEDGAGGRLLLRVGQKHPQAVHAATLLAFDWHPPVDQPQYFSAEMDAQDGPLSTRDYHLLIEAVPLGAGQTFMHMAYAFSYGGASQLAMRMYLGTVARDKVGFSPESPGQVGPESPRVRGMRGLVERNTMRYYLAIDAYLDSLSAPREQQVERRLAAWFDATENYARQLHELDRDEYLRMKRAEVARQRESS